MVLKSLTALVIGGLFCVLAQILLDKTKLTPARILVSFVIFGVILGAIGLFDPLFEFAGCGASLPLFGFGANVAKGVREAIDKEGAIGILKGAFSAASIGCSVSLFTGFLASLFFKGKSKRL
jgi:stage V sporulation protein AE